MFSGGSMTGLNLKFTVDDNSKIGVSGVLY